MENKTITSRKTENRLSYNSIETALGNSGKIVPQAVDI